MGGWRGVAVGVALTLVLAGLEAMGRARDERAGLDDSATRLSWAIGFSTGAGLRDVAPVSIDDFRHGLADGLAGSAAATRTLSRPERFALLRDLAARLDHARLEEIASRLDGEADH